MEYSTIYNNLIQKFREVQNIVIGENHHIVPRCMGGLDGVDNIIRLPPREHFFAHQLLCKIYPQNSKLVYALNMMCVGDIRSGHHRTSRRYGWIREKFIEHHPCKSDVTRNKISSTLKKKYSDPSYSKGIEEKKSEYRRLNPPKGLTVIKKLCDCGCGTEIEYYKGNTPRKYAKGHIVKKPVTDEYRAKLSRVAKERLSKLSPDEMSARMKNSARKHSGDIEKEIERGRNISATKRGKIISKRGKTNP